MPDEEFTREDEIAEHDALIAREAEIAREDFDFEQRRYEPQEGFGSWPEPVTEQPDEFLREGD